MTGGTVSWIQDPPAQRSAVQDDPSSQTIGHEQERFGPGAPLERPPVGPAPQLFVATT
jgi:hypothetical protein